MNMNINGRSVEIPEDPTAKEARIEEILDEIFELHIELEALAKCRLKTLPVYFEAVWHGRKEFEVRKNDRNFRPGDVVILEEWDKLTGYTGHCCLIIVERVFPLDDVAPEFEGYVAFSFSKINTITEG